MPKQLKLKSGGDASLFRKYPYIWAWHKLTGSMDYYIEDLCACAIREQAPYNSVYRSAEGNWVTLGTVRNDGMVSRCEAAVAERFGQGAV